MEDITLRQVLPYAFLLVAALVYWWLVLRPQAIAYHKQRQLISSLAVGDRIVSAGGIHGTIVELDEDTYVLETESGLRLVMDRKAVNRRVAEDS
jgi:preprotein translocase subunit YajC